MVEIVAAAAVVVVEYVLEVAVNVAEFVEVADVRHLLVFVDERD